MNASKMAKLVAIMYWAAASEFPEEYDHYARKAREAEDRAWFYHDSAEFASRYNDTEETYNRAETLHEQVR